MLSSSSNLRIDILPQLASDTIVVAQSENSILNRNKSICSPFGDRYHCLSYSKI